MAMHPQPERVVPAVSQTARLNRLNFLTVEEHIEYSEVLD